MKRRRRGDRGWTSCAHRDAWCDRRLLARIHRYIVDRLRKEIEPLTARRPPSRRLRRAPTVGRWSLLRRDPIAPSQVTATPSAASPSAASPIAASPDFVARQLLRRTGVVFRKTIERERFPVPWWRLVRELRTLKARGEVRGGWFVAGFDGEQYALPDAVTLLRAVRKRGRVAASVPLSMPPSDPLHYRGVLAPEPHAQTA